MTTLQEQLGRLSERGPVVDPPFVVRRAVQLASADVVSDRIPAGRSSLASRRLHVDAGDPIIERRPQPRPRTFGMVAAAVVAVAGMAGVFYVRSGVESPTGDSLPTASSPESIPGTTVVGTLYPTTSGPLLTTPVPAKVPPWVSIARPGWTIETTTGFQPVAAQPASAACPGCGATRLVLAADGPLFSGPLFTAWTLDDDYDLNQLDSPVTIGAIAGRANSRAEGTPTALNRMTVAWPLGPGRTAFVDASGLPNEQVIEMATLLTFESAIPVMAAPPAGFRQIDAPVPGPTTEFYLTLTDGRSVIELSATNAGLHGLVDWRTPGHVLFRELKPHVLDGTTIAFDAHPAEERPIVALDAYWVAGGWGYSIVGHIFNSEAEFFDVLSDLELTDAFSFNAATADAQTPILEGYSSSTGWT
jgi:hypothetical protein